MPEFHERLVSVMDFYRITPTMLAERAEMDPANVSRILHGRNRPTLLTLCRVLRALPEDVNLRNLLLGEHDV